MATSLNEAILISLRKQLKKTQVEGKLMTAKQTMMDGTKCLFSYKGLLSQFLELNSKSIDFVNKEISQDELINLEGKSCVVIELETSTQLGEKDFEYYNIKFEHLPEITFSGISGYHLTIKDEHV